MSARVDLVAHYAINYPDDVARHLERLDPDHATNVLSALPHPTAASLLPHVAPGHAARIVAGLPVETAAAIAGLMRADGVAPLLRRLEPAVVSRVLDALPAAHARGVRELLAHDPDTAGGVMDPDVLTVPAAATVADARALLETHDGAHLYYDVYLVDTQQRLAGTFDLAALMQADPLVPVRAIAKPGTAWLSADAPLESVFAHSGWHTLDAMPVLDGDRHFLGVMRHCHMRQIQEQQASASREDPTVEAMMALGELYWLGLCGLLQGVAATASEAAAPGEPS